MVGGSAGAAMASNVNLYNAGNDVGEAKDNDKARKLIENTVGKAVADQLAAVDNYSVSKLIDQFIGLMQAGAKAKMSESPTALISQSIATAAGAVVGMGGGKPPTSPGVVLVNSSAGQAADAALTAAGRRPPNAILNSGSDDNAQVSGSGARDVKVSDYQKAADQPYNDSGLSAAARAWDKHAGRPGGTFEPLTGSIADKNAAASDFVSSVLNNPNTTRTELSRGGVEFRLPSGQGIRFNADGSFSGILDPKK